MGNVVKATIQGQEYSLVYNSSTGKYEAEVTAPSDSSYQFNAGHYFPVTISATDEAGNTTTISDTVGSFKENLKLYVKEQIKPTITGISPSSNAFIGTSNPKIEFTVLDNSNGQASGFAGINPDSITLTVGGASVSASVITKEAVTGGYKCSYTPSSAIADGNCTVTIRVSDYDGNTSDTASVTFKVDTTPPVLNVTSPSADGSYTNQSKFTVTGKTSDSNSSPVTVAITVNGTSQGTVTVSADGSFSKEVTLAEGTNTIVVTSTDKAGKVSTVTRTINLKTTGPVFKTVTISPNPVKCGNSYTISVTFE
jgi:hypothetical protein